MSKKSSKIVDFDCIELVQPIGTFYIAAIPWLDLEAIAYADIRRIEEEKTGHRAVELGIQRELQPNRVKEIAKYVNLIDATFPTSIIIAVDSEDAKYKNGKMHMKGSGHVAKIIDGQHRIAGLRVGNPSADFVLSVTIFIDMELEDQAITFATINKAQTKVNKSLVYDLFHFAEKRSPQKTCHNIVRLVNQEKGGPFEDKIKILGKADDKEKETITQATFVESLIKYLSNDPVQDRDDIKQSKKLKLVEGVELKKHFFRNLFINAEDEIITLIIWNYFFAIREKWPNAWNKVAPGKILNKSTGFIALMRFLKDAYLYLIKNKDIQIGDIINKDQFKDIFDKIDLHEGDFNPERYLPGSKGQSALYYDLLEKSGIGKRK